MLLAAITQHRTQNARSSKQRNTVAIAFGALRPITCFLESATEEGEGSLNVFEMVVDDGKGRLYKPSDRVLFGRRTPARRADSEKDSIIRGKQSVSKRLL